MLNGPCSGNGSPEGAGEDRRGLWFRLPLSAAADPPALPPNVDGKEPIDEGVKARVEEAKEEEDVAEGRGYLLLGQHLRGEPVPQAEQVVGAPADHKGQDNDQGHPEGPCPHAGNVVVGTAEVELSGLGGGCGRKRKVE